MCRSYQKDTIGGYHGKSRQKRTARLPGGDHTDPDRGQMEGADPAGPDAGDKAVRRTEKVHRQCVTEGADGPASRHGGKWFCPPAGLCRGAAAGGVFPDRPGQKPEAHPGLHVGVG